ncbi:patched domain-containing protein 3-like [Centruroides sculpturatus]|uniref:patched domain-containing protein 3-like n=1 Tax=Centruroides sculpturatus TaxID=218467 RepID=UPI000C6DDA93|nr:patched domain-containing protein 3-like [Centruroides sculpturatus]
MKRNYVKTMLSLAFHKIGHNIGRYPQVYITLTILATVVLGSGFYKITIKKNYEYLFTRNESRVKMERQYIESKFSIDIPTGEDIFRVTRYKEFGSIIILPKNKSYIDRYAMDDIMKLDKVVRNISFYWKNRFVGFHDLFHKSVDKYTRDMILFFRKNIKKIEEGRVSIKFPIEIKNFRLNAYALNLGGVNTTETSSVRKFKSFRLTYMMRNDNEEANSFGVKWEENFVKILKNLQFNSIDFYLMTSQTYEDEANLNTLLSIPLSFIFMPLTLLFAVLSCVSSDVITSKPLIGIATCISPVCGCISASGLLSWCNVEYVDINLCINFLILGIGINDSFSLLASWKRTNREDSVQKRMAETYSSIGPAITLASLTNFLVFSIGAIAPHKIVQIFSLYSLLAILLNYIYQIFLFGGFMAIDGYREKHNLHCLLLTSVNREISGKGSCQQKKNDRTNDDVIISFLGNKIVKASSMFIFIFYIPFSIYFLMNVKENLNWLNVYPRDSMTFKYLSAHYKYYTQYPHVIQIIFNETLDYSDPNVQSDLDEILYEFQSSFFVSNVSVCWFKEYTAVYKDPNSNYILKDYNISNSKEFLEGLKNVFLKFKLSQPFTDDILFNDNRDEILASRCYILSRNVKDSRDEKILLQNLQEISRNSKYSVFTFNRWFPVYEEYFGILLLWIKSIGITALIITIVFSLFMLDIIYAFSAALTVITIQMATTGFMALWNVELDSITTIILLMSSGYCIDFLAHVMNCCKSCKEKEHNERIKGIMHNVGYAIFQSFVTMLIGILIFYFGPSDIFTVFSKIIFLFMLFAFFQCLLLIPVILTIGESVQTFSWKKKLSFKD